MKLLKIENSQGYYHAENGDFDTIDKLTKDDLLRLVNFTLNEDDVEFEEYDEERLRNQAHRIIYRSIYEKLQGLRDRKQEFKDESERLYLPEYERYRDDLSQPPVATEENSTSTAPHR